MILSFFSSQGWESWEIERRPLIPERMPVLVDNDLRFEDAPGASRPAVVVNRWPRELPASGAPSPKTWEARLGAAGTRAIMGGARTTCVGCWPGSGRSASSP
ncbi:MAG: hypothetical protein ACRDRA_17430 [Pseudonocardiaceae bacterium]